MFSLVQNISFLPYVFLLITYLGGITAISINIASGEVILSEKENQASVYVLKINQLVLSEKVSIADFSIKMDSRALIQSGSRFVPIPYDLKLYPVLYEADNSIFRLSSIFSRPPPFTPLYL